jgi:hypothetical protein
VDEAADGALGVSTRASTSTSAAAGSTTSNGTPRPAAGHTLSFGASDVAAT